MLSSGYVLKTVQTVDPHSKRKTNGCSLTYVAQMDKESVSVCVCVCGCVWCVCVMCVCARVFVYWKTVFSWFGLIVILRVLLRIM